MNFAEMMARNIREDDTATLTHDQQVARLTEYFAQVYGQEPERFAPGTIIWHKNPELADTKGAGDPVLFVRYLPERVQALDVKFTDLDDLFGNGTPKTMDCVVMVIKQGKAPQYLMESRFYTAKPPRA